MKTYYSKIYLVIILCLISFNESRAGDPPPANDNFASAINLVLDQGTAAALATNAHATKEAGEPGHAENLGGCSVWFKFTPSATKVYRMNTTDSNFDTLLAVYTGNSVNNLTAVGYNDNGNSDAAFGGASTVDLMLTAGTTYHIAVDGLRSPGANPEQGNFKIAILEYESPASDNLSSSYYLGYGFRGGIAGTNYNATSEQGEPIAQASTGPTRRSVWYRWTSNDSFSVVFELTENFKSQIGIYTSSVGSPTMAQLTQVETNVDYASFSDSSYKLNFFAQKDRTYYIQIESHNLDGATNQVGNFQLKYNLNPLQYTTVSDSYGGRTGLYLFRPSDGTWYGITSLNHQVTHIRKFGMNGDVPIAADFDGEGHSQFAAIRNENGKKMWYISGFGSTFKAIPWGLPTDKPVVGDVDRDGRADLGVIRNSANGYLWYFRASRNGSMMVFNFGTTGDKPVLGDFDGDSMTDIAVLRNTQTGLVWYVLKSGFNAADLSYSVSDVYNFGTAGDLPVAEDYDGDGRTDVAVFRPSNGVWYILRSSDGQVMSKAWGMAGDKPQPGDYDGDRKADLAVYRPSNGSWYFILSGSNTEQGVTWGLPTDIPVSSLSTLSH